MRGERRLWVGSARASVDNECLLRLPAYREAAILVSANVGRLCAVTHKQLLAAFRCSLGLKGAGEAGSIGSKPAVMNAVNDALWRAYGLDHLDMPATPLAVYSAIAAAGAKS
jgi:hypothetical protein